MNNDDLPAKKPVNSVASSSGKVFDVVRPGKVLASPTSRPVIVGHKPVTQDDQFVMPPDRQLMDHKQTAELPQPIPEPTVPDEAPESVPPAPVAVDEPVSLPTDTPQEKPTPQGLAVAQTVSAPDPELTVASEPSVAQDNAMEQAIAATDENLLSDSTAPLIDQAFVSHHAAPRSTGKVILLLIVIVLLLVVILDLLLDAKLLKLNGIPHTQFIG